RLPSRHGRPQGIGARRRRRLLRAGHALGAWRVRHTRRAASAGDAPGGARRRNGRVRPGLARGPRRLGGSREVLVKTQQPSPARPRLTPLDELVNTPEFEAEAERSLPTDAYRSISGSDRAPFER